ncbi:MAG: sugar ABC transporter permease [Anaerolineae bacterium]|nr:sugar ABC transporter permease [Anaerolineae bacterium]
MGSVRLIRLSHRHLSPQERRRLLTGLAFLSPWIIGFLAFILYPLVTSLYYSFTDFSLFTAPDWVGIENYRELFTADDKFLLSLYNTIYFAALVMPASIVLALLMALVLNLPLRGISFYRAIFFMPTIVPAVASAIVWSWILNPGWGLLNGFLRIFGIPGPPWMTSPAWAKPSLVLVTLWAIGSDMIIYLAALKDIPSTYYEASSLDGANTWQKIMRITLPLVTPVIFFHLVNGTIWAFQYFTIAFVMTDGGPANATLFYALYLYRNAFEYIRMGYASAMAWILFAIVMGTTLLMLRSSNKWVYYEG